MTSNAHPTDLPAKYAVIRIVRLNYYRISVEALCGDGTYLFKEGSVDRLPTIEFTSFVKNADFAAIQYNDTPGDTIQDLIKAKAKIIAQNTSGNVCGMLPGGWQGNQYGFTLFAKANNIVTLMIILQYDSYSAYYNTSTDTVSSIKKITMTSV